jgi:hypothetical protein
MPRKNPYPVGARVRVAASGGLASEKTGRIMKPEVDGRGIPKVPGAYSPYRHSGRMAERVVKLDDGQLFVVFCVSLTVIPEV